MDPIFEGMVAVEVAKYMNSPKVRREIIITTKLPCGKDNKPRNIPSSVATDMLRGKKVKIGDKLYYFDTRENKVKEVDYD
jgi:hypothetical protein